MFRSDHDRRFFLRVLHESSQKTGCAIHSFSLMPNHYHVLASPVEADGLSRMSQMIGRRYVRYFNALHERTGTLWEGRFWSAAIDSEGYFLKCSRYIETNADRAGLARDPVSYPWSSARCNLLGIADKLVTPHWLYLALGDRPEERQRAYRALFDLPQDADSLEVIRLATRRNSRVTIAEERLNLENDARRRR